MQVMQKLLSMLLVAFFATFAGVTSAASDVSPVKSMSGIDSGTVQQTPAPPDCKKDPQDPRCGK